MDTTLDSLDPRFKPLAITLLARLVEARLPVLIVNTRRTAAEQAAAIARHVSWVAHSLHQDGLAIDVAPYDVYALHGDDKLQWNTNDPVWLTIGAIGEALGLRWGGRFHPINTAGIGMDPGHFEYIAPAQTGVPT
jgi:hypothetical protein